MSLTFLAVAVSGAIGAVLRYSVTLMVGVRGFPWATLGVNVVGSFGLALLLVLSSSGRWSPALTTAISVGLLGSFTTFSAFGYETFVLWRGGQVGVASAYAVLSLVLGVGAVIAGNSVGRVVV